MMSDPRVRLAVGMAFGVAFLDQITKSLVAASMTPYETIPLLPFFALTYVRNTGAAFSLLSGAPGWVRIPLFVGVTVGALWLLGSTLRQTAPERRGLILAMGAIVGGAIGNLLDRLRWGEVIDFLHFHVGGWSWPMFNVADSAITIGVIVVLVASLNRPVESVDDPA
jgi:signal peptidase II